MNQSNQEKVIRLELPANFKYLNVLGACVGAMLERVEDLADREIVAYNVELALHETCTNIVAHAYAGKTGRIDVEIHLEEEPRRLVIDLRDNGMSFNLDATPQPNLNEAQTNGYGLFLIKELLDEVTYNPGKSENHWRLVKYLL